MLARRFTLVCVMIALFGMALSSLVAQNSAPSYAQSGIFGACDFTSAPCLLPLSR